MRSSPYTHYYVNQNHSQNGNGLPGYQGVDFQNGDGFIDNIFKGAILPIIKYFGKRALSTGVDVVSDTLGGENFIESLKKRANATARHIASDAGERAMKFAQTGKGRKRKSLQFGEGRKKRKVSQLGKGRKRKRISSQIGKGKRKRISAIAKRRKQRKLVQLGSGKSKKSTKKSLKLISSIFN